MRTVVARKSFGENRYWWKIQPEPLSRAEKLVRAFSVEQISRTDPNGCHSGPNLLETPFNILAMIDKHAQTCL
jgi:hypothetical protein